MRIYTLGWAASALGVLLAASQTLGGELPVVEDVPLQPISAQAKRVAEALEWLGQPLDGQQKKALDRAALFKDEKQGVQAIQQVLDPLCLVGVTVNPESRVKVQRGPASADLAQGGWRVFLVKVQNEAGVTAALKVSSPNAKPVYRQSSGSPSPKPGPPEGSERDRWADVRMFDDRPLNPTLSGLGLEYRILQIYSRDAGPRDARLSFDVGQGTQDLGFRSDVDILFDAAESVEVVLEAREQGGGPVWAAYEIRDTQGRVYPAQSRRLAPDFFFHPQVYRAPGESVVLPPGSYSVKVSRGPEYLVESRRISVPEKGPHRESFTLERWIDPAKLGWYSGDHHVHAAGCGHYESPTEGVSPADMMRQILGEDLKVGCVLSWGPCWYAQKQYFQGKDNPLSTPEHLMRYDVEVSGFPSSHCGHLCLLRLQEDDYPGTTSIDQWPSWDLPVLKWGQSQDAVVGFSHSGWGLVTKSREIPTLEVPPFDGIGANEYIVDVTHGAVDFISTVDTPAFAELSIWYHTLNCGFRTRISGETDFPCIYGERVGLGRSYVKLTGQTLDYDAWADGIRQGRSYVTDGMSHLIGFQVEDVKVGEDGSEFKLSKPGPVTVRARVAARLDEQLSPEARDIRERPLDQKPYWHLERARMGDSRQVPVEVVVNGQVVLRHPVEADGSLQDLEFQVPIKQSSWVALRILPSSHTNPVFVIVDDKPVRASRDSAEWCLKSVDQCWGQKVKKIRPEEQPAAKAAYDHARRAYRKILSETDHQ